MQQQEQVTNIRLQWGNVVITLDNPNFRYGFLQGLDSIESPGILCGSITPIFAMAFYRGEKAIEQNAKKNLVERENL